MEENSMQEILKKAEEEAVKSFRGSRWDYGRISDWKRRLQIRRRSCAMHSTAGSHTLILRTTTDIRQTALRRKISVRRLRIVLVHTGMSL